MIDLRKYGFDSSQQAYLHKLFSTSLEYMRQHGWTQGTAVDYKGRVCAVGALQVGKTELERSGKRPPVGFTRAEEALGVVLRISKGVPAWNDAGNKTQDMVERGFQRAIKATTGVKA